MVGILGPTAALADYDGPVTAAVADLPTATESRTGYDRDLFDHWIDADGDGCDTRLSRGSCDARKPWA